MAGQGFDLGTAQPVTEREDEGIKVEIRGLDEEIVTYQNGDGSARPVTVTVAGSYSSVFRRATEAQTSRQLKSRGGALTCEDLYKSRVGLVAACILAWDGFFNDGQPLRLSKDNAFKVLDRAPWILRQVEAAMEDHEGFFGSSSSSS